MKETILLIGGAGFIGSHLAEAYAQTDSTVVIVDDLSTGYLENITHLLNKQNVFFYEASILDVAKLTEIFEQHRPTIINNHAAQKSVPYSVENPMKDLELNIIGLLNIIKLAKQYKVKRILSASSGGALACEIDDEHPVSNETSTPQLKSPYAITKYAGEKYLEVYSKLYGFEYIGLRYANVFGPRQVADGDCGVVPIFVNNIKNNQDSILMAYDDMPDGCIRDYIYVDDVVDFNLLATKDEVKGDIFNLGIGKGFTMRYIFEQLKKAYASDTELIRKGPRQGDIKISILDCSKVKKILNWETTTSLEEGIALLHKYTE